VIESCSSPFDACTLLWPRRGSHGQNQIVDFTRREVCWVKYGNPRRFECWRWDDRFIYHAVDHGLDGDSNESYLLTDGRWLARDIPASATAAAPWTLDVAQNQLVWFDASCRVDPARSHAFPYRQRAWFERRYPKAPGDSDGVYRSAIRAKALDTLRGLLPDGRQPGSVYAA
jgi:hypothetical protein